MKARVKATGEVIEVEHTAYDVNGKVIWRYADIEDASLYTDGQLDFNLEENHKGSQIIPLPYEPDYWEKLKHQYAGMAMQGMLSNSAYLENFVKYCVEGESFTTVVTANAIDYATALVNRLKEESQCEK